LRNAPSLNKLNTNPLPVTSSGKGNALSNQKQISISDKKTNKHLNNNRPLKIYN